MIHSLIRIYLALCTNFGKLNSNTLYAYILACSRKFPQLLVIFK